MTIVATLPVAVQPDIMSAEAQPEPVAISTPQDVATYIVATGERAAFRAYVAQSGRVPDTNDPDYRAVLLMTVSMASEAYMEHPNWPLADRLDHVSHELAVWLAMTLRMVTT